MNNNYTSRDASAYLMSKTDGDTIALSLSPNTSTLKPLTPYEQVNAIILSLQISSCASTWLIDALNSALKRDCVDVLKDINLLQMIFQVKADYMLSRDNTEILKDIDD
jgi:hypothetical protein